MSRFPPVRPLLAIAIAVSACCGAGKTAAADFDADLTGPFAPVLTIPFSSYGFTPEGLLRTSSASRDQNGVDRPVVRTVAGGYLDRDFVFEVSVTVPETAEDIVFVGVGRGSPDPQFSNEPEAALYFRIHSGLGANEIHAVVTAAAAEVAASGRFAYQEVLGHYTPGRPITVRIERAGDTARVSVPGQAGASRTVSLASHRSRIGAEGYLFFGNSAEGTTFTHAAVTSAGAGK